MSKDVICNILLETKYMGMQAFLEWLCSTDFFTAPASTRYHSCHEGGLAEHSYHVYELLKRKRKMVEGLSEESCAVCGLLHDVCKIGVYRKTWRNVQKYHDGGKRQDEAGKYDWAKEESYTFEDPLPLGHGAKSLYLINQNLRLSDQESAMILHHMGAFPGGDAARDFAAAANKWPAVALMCTADIEASYCLEKREEGKS